jgi:Ca2+-transporting ATPase
MSTVVLGEGGVFMYTKGASEIILESCSHMQNYEGSSVPIDAALKQQIEGAIAHMANQALRTIIIAKKTVQN